jgi:hypothetical protein
MLEQNVLLVRVRDHAVVHIRPPVTGLIVVRTVIVIVLVVHIEGLGIGWQRTHHSPDGQTRHRAHRGPAPTTATAVVSPIATATCDADITGLIHIDVFIIGVSSVIPVVLPPVIPPTMVTAPGTASMVAPKAATAEAAVVASATVVAFKAAAMRAAEATATPAAPPTAGLGLLGEKGEAENKG